MSRCDLPIVYVPPGDVSADQLDHVEFVLVGGLLFSRCSWSRWARYRARRQARTAQPRPGDTVQVIETTGLADGYIPPSGNLFPPSDG